LQKANSSLHNLFYKDHINFKDNINTFKQLLFLSFCRKLWVLFSPKCSDSMQPTRIPYEESTIYSKYNFFTPSELEIEAIKNLPGSVKMVILEPKDVLFVPKGWWHFVESLDTSLSINVWLPLKEDCNTRLQETLVHLVMNSLGTSIPKTINQLESNLLECMSFVSM
jgi:HSPB1-associated protein 1